MPAHGPHRSVTVMLPADLVDVLDEASRARDIGRRWLIERLLAEGVERLIPVEELRLTRDSRAVRLEPGERPGTMTAPGVPVVANGPYDVTRCPFVAYEESEGWQDIRLMPPGLVGGDELRCVFLDGHTGDHCHGRITVTPNI